MQHKLDVYRRDDGRWTWRLHAVTGSVIAVDGSDGFANKADAVNTARELLAGEIEVVIERELVIVALNGSSN